MKMKSIILPLLLATFLYPNCFGQSNESMRERVEAWEKRINEHRHPPEKVLDACGVKPGMVIGELGAGRGRYTVLLAHRVGIKGKVYANDINNKSLSYLRDRCQWDNIKNIEAILGGVEDPLFPKYSLDMVFMIWVYHMLDKPESIMRNLKSSLKPGAKVVIVDPHDDEINEEMKQLGKKLDPPTLKERIEKCAQETGLQLVEIKTFLPKDDIYILKVKAI